MSYLMTHSLLSSWQYCLKENPFEDATSERDSFAEFLQVLRREPTPTNEAMQNGIDFEDLVTKILLGVDTVPCEIIDAELKGSVITEESIRSHPWFLAASKVAGIIRHGQLQVVAKKQIIVDNTPLLLYGRLDALKAGGVYDIKFSKSYDRGKYFDSTQHPMYMELVPAAKDFSYLVSNGEHVWTEKYRRDECKNIRHTISDFLGWLEVMGLMDLYRQHWSTT